MLHKALDCFSRMVMTQFGFTHTRWNYITLLKTNFNHEL